MKLYDKVKDLLEGYPHLRSNDKILVWVIWNGDETLLTLSKYSQAPSSESITRARRKVQENHPHLKANKTVKAYRDDLARQKGTISIGERLR